MRDYHREACERVIRYGIAWAQRVGLEWSDKLRRYPSIDCSPENAPYEAWYVDSAVHCAHALLAGDDLRYAFRCYLQVREYGARCIGQGAGRAHPDSHWADLATGLKDALEECLGLLNDYTPNNCDSAQVPKCAQCGERRYDDKHRCL
jgi:hypothetical protein